MTEAPCAADASVVLVPGANLGLLDGALIVRRGGKTLRLAHVSTEATARVARELGRRGPFSPRDPDEQALVDALLDRGFAARSGCVTLFDPEGLLGEVEGTVVHHARSPTDATCEASTWVAVGSGADGGAVGELVDAARQRKRLCWVLTLGGEEAMLCREHPDERGCPRCAAVFDRSVLERFGPRGLLLSAPPSAASRALGRALLAARLAPGAPPWVRATAQIATIAGPTCRTESVPSHPQCPCATRGPRPEAVAPAHVDPERLWSALAARRFAPIWPIDATRGDAVVRVAFTRSRDPKTIGQAHVGMALASGERALARALHEAGERFAMLHGAPDLQDVSAEALGPRALPWPAIERLLPPDDAYDQPGFRHVRPTPSLPLDWVEVARDGVAEGRYVPASVVGCLRRGATRIADPTSSGWACHAERDAARALALLELIERDALLRFWFTRTEASVVAARSLADVVVLALRPRVSVEVVLALGLADDGGLRTGSGVAIRAEDAIAHALAELELARSARAEGDAERATLAAAVATPEDHRAYWSGARGRALFDELVARATTTPRGDAQDARPALEGGALLRHLTALLDAGGLTAWFAERQLADVLPGCVAVRAVVPGLIELSFGSPYARTRLIRERVVEHRPHPFA